MRLVGSMAFGSLARWLPRYSHIFMFVLQLHEYHCGKSIIKIALSLLQYDVENKVVPPPAPASRFSKLGGAASKPLASFG